MGKKTKKENSPPKESTKASQKKAAPKEEVDLSKELKSLKKDVRRLTKKITKYEETMEDTKNLLDQLHTEPATVVTLIERITRDSQSLQILTTLLQSLEGWLGAQARDTYTYREQHRIAGLFREFVQNFLGPQLCSSCLGKLKAGIGRTPLAKYLEAAGLFRVQQKSNRKGGGYRGR